MSRLSYKGMQATVEEAAKALEIDGLLHLNASMGYYQLQMYVTDANGQKENSGAVNTLVSGSLQEINQYLRASNLRYYADRVKAKRPQQGWPNLHIAVGSLNAALGNKWKTMSDNQAAKMESVLASDLHHALHNGEEIITKDDYYNLLRNAFDMAMKTRISIKE